ncbi:post-transcriptional regulator [Paenibacillus sp. LHD-38]|uniref:post-transcriptional regulator n=1 Tax=Paenibacillus sp. LHD-38 TaxID=3072143 RepID=UPI00281034E1|nr:post-transcriptional regulator [Paenibacillus sp. LHD-38]MDQ8737371.1 post-transcriptional regulator [Paenibacillus sp. LHD-38]
MEDEELSRMIEELCISKAEEFQLIGYEHVTGQEVWECVSEKYKKTGLPELHELVNDILSLKVMKFMNFVTISAYKGTSF